MDRLPTALAPAPVPLITEQYAKAIKRGAVKAGDDDGDNDEASEASGADEDKPKDTPQKKPAGYRFNVEPLKKDKASKPKASKNQKPPKAKADDPKVDAIAYGRVLAP